MCPIGAQLLLSSFHEFAHDGYWLDHRLSGSRTKEMPESRNFQFDINSPVQNTVYPKTKDAFPKIQAWAHNRYSPLHQSHLLKYSGDYWQSRKPRMKSEFTFFQSLSWLFQLASLTSSKLCKRTLLELISINHIQVHEEKETFVIASLRLSQNVKLGIFMWQSCCDSKEMYKKVWCTCKVVVCLIKPLLFLLSRCRCISNFPLFMIHCDLSETEFSQCKLNCSW